MLQRRLYRIGAKNQKAAQRNPERFSPGEWKLDAQGVGEQNVRPAARLRRWRRGRLGGRVPCEARRIFRRQAQHDVLRKCADLASPSREHRDSRDDEQYGKRQPKEAPSLHLIVLIR